MLKNFRVIIQSVSHVRWENVTLNTCILNTEYILYSHIVDVRESAQSSFDIRLIIKDKLHEDLKEINDRNPS
jgi:hypothetical protein